MGGTEGQSAKKKTVRKQVFAFMDLKGIEPLTLRMRTVRSGARVTSGRKKKNKNERKDRRTNLFSLFNMQDKVSL